MTKGKRRYLLELVENSDACEHCGKMWRAWLYFDAFCDAECRAAHKRARFLETLPWL